MLLPHAYLPFGEEVWSGTGSRSSVQGYGAADAVRKNYAGLERDDVTGLDHTLWRKMDSTAGRWTSPDPYGGSMRMGAPQSFNRYAYVENDPVNFTDPSGLDMSTGGCSAEYSYDQCGGDDGFWGSNHYRGSGAFGDDIGEFNRDYAGMPLDLVLQVHAYIQRAYTAFDNHYSGATDSSAWIRNPLTGENEYAGCAVFMINLPREVWCPTCPRQNDFPMQ